MRSLAELDRLLAMMEVTVEHAERHCIGPRVEQEPPRAGVVLACYVTAGRTGLVTTRRRPRSCDAGAMIIVPAGLESAFVADPDGAPGQLVISRVGVCVSGAGLLDRVRVPIVADLSASPVVSLAIDELLRLSGEDAQRLGSFALSNSLMKICILAVLRDFFGRPGIDLKIVSALADPRLAAVIAAVLERPHGAHSLASMADDAGLSRSTFSRLFAEAMGQSPMEFVAKTRLYYAAELLRTSKAPIKAVAMQVGFSSRSHFSRAFREAYGTDPTSYRRERTGMSPAPVAQDLREIDRQNARNGNF